MTFIDGWKGTKVQVLFQTKAWYFLTIAVCQLWFFNAWLIVVGSWYECEMDVDKHVIWYGSSLGLNVPTFEWVVMGWRVEAEIGGEGTKVDTGLDVAGHMEEWEEVRDMVCKTGIVKDVDEVCGVGLEPFIGRDE